jgi:amidase
MTSQTLAFVPGVPVARARHKEGLLSGLSFAVKDVFAVRGHASSAGHPDYARTHEAAAHDADVVAALLDAGADLLGVTVLDELAFSLVGQNPHYGTPANPRAPGRVCGGSSCGSAAAVAACLCDFALGTDTAGSVRVPASFCGLFGLRPTHGALSVRGVVPLAPSFDTVGLLAREPRTFEAVASVLLGGAEKGAVERVLVADDALELCDAGVAELLDHLLQRACSALSVKDVERIRLAPEGFEPLRTAFRRLQAREAAQQHGEWLERVKPNLSAGVAERFAYGRQLLEAGEELAEEARVRAGLRERLAELLGPRTLLFLPATPGIAPRLDAGAEALDKFRARALELTSIASLAGLPQLVVPARELEGAPLGLSFISAAGSDAWLGGLAPAFDHVLRA